MKRTKHDNQPNTISLSSKRHSFQQDKFITPQKTDWNIPLQTMDSNNSKTFFTHMKAELSNIKSDFERLIQREDKTAALGPKEKEVLQMKHGWHTGAKGKSYSSYKAQERPILFDKMPDFDPYEPNPKKYQAIEQNNKIFNLNKNINEAVSFKNKHILPKEKEPCNNPVSKYFSINPKSEEVKESNQNSLNPRKQAQSQAKDKELLQLKTENMRQKEAIATFEQEIAISIQDKQKMRCQLAQLAQDSSLLQQKVESLKAEMLEKSQKMKVDDQNIAKYRGMVEKMNQTEKKLQETQADFQQLHSGILTQRQEMEKQRFFYNQKIQELSFYNANFFKDNSQLTEENNQLKDAISHLQNIVEDSKRIANETEKENQRKLDHLSKNLTEYQKRQRMFQGELEKLYSQLSAKNETSHEQVIQVTKGPSLAFHEQQMCRLQSQLAKQQSINDLISRKYKEELQKLKIEQLNQTFQSTVQALSDQNLSLKNRCNAAESKIEELLEKSHCFEKEIALYEERERDNRRSKSLSCTEWEEMTQRIELLQIENKKLLEERDYKELLKEVLAQNKSQIVIEVNHQYQNLQNLVKDQLEQNLTLKLGVEKLAREVQQLQEELRISTIHKEKLEGEVKILLSTPKEAATTSILQKHQQIHNQLQAKARTITLLKSFILQMANKRLQSQGCEEQRISCMLESLQAI